MLIAATVGPLGWAYLICLLLGVFYGVFAGLFAIVGGHDGGHHEIESPGHTEVEVSQMGHEPGTVDSGMHMTPLNPVVVSIFLVSFGGTGLASMQLFDWNLASLAVAAPSGFVLAAITFAIFEKIFSATQGSSEPAQQEIVGKDAEVITPIPENGLGEIAFTRRGSRFTAAARSESGAPVAKNAVVTVTRIVGHTHYVKSSGGAS
jgi:membrane protein implicated in regulation of membrane protease activity